jgi:hypothetical protein
VAVSAGHPLREAHPWGGWWWVSETIGEPLVVGLAGFPPLLFWARTASALRRQDWWTLGRWVGGALLATVVLATAILYFDRQHKLPEETYAARGWYGIGFAGVYVAGVFGLLELAWQRAQRWLRRLRGAADPHVPRA